MRLLLYKTIMKTWGKPQKIYHIIQDHRKGELQNNHKARKNKMTKVVMNSPRTSHCKVPKKS